jgi:hypothetical protein
MDIPDKKCKDRHIPVASLSYLKAARQNWNITSNKITKIKEPFYKDDDFSPSESNYDISITRSDLQQKPQMTSTRPSAEVSKVTTKNK